jgi:hypothetical protein
VKDAMSTPLPIHLAAPDCRFLPPKGKAGKTVPMKPPAPRAPAVLEQRPALERELSDLKQQIAETALAAYEGKAGGRENLAALHSAIEVCKFQIDCNEGAHALALQIDRDAMATWRAKLQANPQKAVEGITKKDCCRRCSFELGCAISGEACAHPIKVRGVSPGLRGDPKIRALFNAAAEEIKVSI